MTISKDQARSQNLKTYFTGKPCKRGHLANRYTSTSNCVECQTESNRKFYIDNSEKEQQRQKLYYKNNKAKCIQATLNYQSRNPEIKIKANKVYREKHKEKIAAYKAEWKKYNRLSLKTSRIKRRAARLQAVPSWVNHEELKEVYRKCPGGHEIDHICYRCESTTQYLSVCTSIVGKMMGEVLLESIIGGRPISIIRLYNPIEFREWHISCLEITCPKAGRVHKHGYEHVEVVIGSAKDGFTNSLSFLTDFAAKFPSVEFDRKAIDKEINADLSLTTPDGSSIKYHSRPIYEVCEYEISHKHFVAVPDNYFSEKAV